LSHTLSQNVLVRAAWNRKVQHPENYLWAFLENQPVAGTLTVTIHLLHLYSTLAICRDVILAKVELCRVSGHYTPTGAGEPICP